VTISAYSFPNLNLTALGQSSTLKLTSDTLKVGLTTGAVLYTRGSGNYGQTTVQQFLNGDGTHGTQTEVSTSGTGYSRQALGSVSLSDSGLVTTLSCAAMAWNAIATWSAAYAFFYDYTAGGNSDTAGILLGYWDLGGASTVNNGGTFQLTPNASGLITWSLAA
jgi:hypothetical protein